MKKIYALKRRSRICATTLFAFLFSLILLDIAQSADTHSAPRVSPTKVTPTTLGKPDLVRQYQQTITPASLASRLYFLASDSLEGRETATAQP